MAEYPLWKIGAVPTSRGVNVVDLLNTARNFYDNRFDIIDSAVNDLNLRKRQGTFTDLDYLDALNSLASAYKTRSSTPNLSGVVSDLGQQASEAIAQQGFKDYSAAQQRALESMYNNADLQFAKAQSDFEKGKISSQDFDLARNEYFAIQKSRGTIPDTTYSYDQFRPGAQLNIYKSGRMRDIAREQAISQAFQEVFGQSYDGNKVAETAGSYLPVEALKAIFQGQKAHGLNANQAGYLPGEYIPGNPQSGLTPYSGPGSSNYLFPGTGGKAGGNPYSPQAHEKYLSTPVFSTGTSVSGGYR